MDEWEEDIYDEIKANNQRKRGAKVGVQGINAGIRLAKKLVVNDNVYEYVCGVVTSDEVRLVAQEGVEDEVTQLMFMAFMYAIAAKQDGYFGDCDLFVTILEERLTSKITFEWDYGDVVKEIERFEKQRRIEESLGE